MGNTLILKDQVAVITGGGTGIGLAISVEMARAGANIVAASRSMEHLQRAVKDVTSLGRRCLAVPTDVRKPEEVDHMVERALQYFGHVDILVNNAGASFLCPVEDMSPNGWDTVIEINLKGTFLCSRAVGKMAMIPKRKGTIINIASISGRDGWPLAAHYAAAKAGVINFTKSLAVEWARHNIKVNCIATGRIITEWMEEAMKKAGVTEPPRSMHALGRWGEPSEIARVAVFLASEGASYLAGETLYVDGGPYDVTKLYGEGMRTT